MMDLIPHLAVFLAAGIFGGVALGLMGVGMALVAVPLLIFILPGFGFAPDAVPLVALATSMAVVSAGSVSSVLGHSRRGNVDWRVARTTIPASLAGIVTGTLAASHLPGMWLRLLFCLFLVHVAVRMLRAKAPAGPAERPPTTALRYRLTGFSIGLAASVIGAGGGVLMVPFLASRGHPMIKAVATSTLIGLPVSVAGAVIYAAQPVDLPQDYMVGYLFLPAFAGLAIGSVIGAPLGGRLGSRLPAATLKRVFAVALLVVAAAIAAGV